MFILRKILIFPHENLTLLVGEKFMFKIWTRLPVVLLGLTLLTFLPAKLPYDVTKRSQRMKMVAVSIILLAFVAAVLSLFLYTIMMEPLVNVRVGGVAYVVR